MSGALCVGPIGGVRSSFRHLELFYFSNNVV